MFHGHLYIQGRLSENDRTHTILQYLGRLRCNFRSHFPNQFDRQERMAIVHNYQTSEIFYPSIGVTTQVYPNEGLPKL